MKIFQCGNCHHSLFFESQHCENCGHLAGFWDKDRLMLTFDPDQKKLKSDSTNSEYKFCENHKYGVCNWVLEKKDSQEFCRACQLNRTIPNLSDNVNFERWQNLEIAKHRLIYQLQRIGLPLPSKMQNEDGLCFDFVSSKFNPKLMTGHASGIITILLKEADSALREKARMQLMEPYRALIGHLRHEVGHYFWERLVMNNPSVLKKFRKIFGNEKIDYSDSLNEYYSREISDDWQNSYISKYASAHAWEDWAESWAHYLHIMDMVETSFFFGLYVSPVNAGHDMEAEATFDPYAVKNFNQIIKICVPLSFAVNSLNRSMGIADVYPFVLSPAVVKKMRFIHRLLLPFRK